MKPNILLRALTALFSAAPLLAQCAMCYQNASAQGARGIQALNLGVLVLIVPPMAIIGCISWVAYRRSK